MRIMIDVANQGMTERQEFKTGPPKLIVKEAVVWPQSGKEDGVRLEPRWEAS